jgi:hypothetical protein
MDPFPLRPLQMINDEQVQSFREREKCMAYNLLHAVTENPGQQNFVAFVGKEHLFPVTKQISDFLNNPESFMSYKRPPQAIDDSVIEQDTDGVLKKELIKTFALGKTLYESETTENNALPFVHHKSKDIETLKEESRQILSKMAFVDLFGDFSGLELSEHLDSADFTPVK